MLNTKTISSAQASTDSAPIRIAIQGYAGAFHEIAARYCFKDQPIEIVPSNTFFDLIQKVEQQEEADLGIMAIENTLAGSLMANYTLLNQTSLKIVGEVYLRIKQNLLVLPGTKIEELTEVHSHPIAIAQCVEFFKQYPRIKLIEKLDTALSAKEIREKDLKNTGAIASTLAADLYNMEMLESSIETNKKNHTRFLVLQHKHGRGVPEGSDKVSLCFAVDHEVGSLYKVLGVLAAYNVNLTKIQSTPIIGKPWEYLFYLDFVEDGHLSYEHAIDAIRPLTKNLNVLGIYKRGEHFEY